MTDPTLNDVNVLLSTSRFQVVRHRRLLRDGRLHVRETVQHPGSVVILPLLDDGRVCLLRNFRIAVNETLVELPAGTLDRQEPPIATAARELAEETGYAAARLEPFGTLLMSPGILNERMHLFIARGVTRGKASPEEGEELEAFEAAWHEAIEMIEDGRIQDAKTVAALLLYDRRGSKT
jgi:ADP-ribose pyrophosphatase